MARIYNLTKDVPDGRDFKLHYEPHTSVRLPSTVDLRAKCPPVFDQGDLGSCTANAGVGARMYQSVSTMLSRLDLYYCERVLEGTINQDSGASIRDICKVLNKWGVCEESFYPYDITKFTQPPSPAAACNAFKYIINVYHSLSTLDDIKNYLAFNQKPIIMGMDVYTSFESDKVAKTGSVPMPKKNEQMLGGHAVLIVGYSNTKKKLIVRNSWGTNWGMEGYFYLPYDYVSKGLAYDFWVIDK